MVNRRVAQVLGIILVVAVVIISALALSAYYSNDDDHAITEALVISGDSELAESKHVVRGNGTLGNPYIIEDLEIQVNEQPHSIVQYGMRVSSTQAHLVIYNLTFTVDSSRDYADYHHEEYNGLGLWGVRNLTVESCTFESLTSGIVVHHSNINVSSSKFTLCRVGVDMDDMGVSPIDSATIWRNEFWECDYGIYMKMWWNIRIMHNDFYSCGIDIRGYDNIVVEICNNGFHSTRVACVYLTGAATTTIALNEASHGKGDTFRLMGVSSTSVSGNSIGNAGCGVLIQNSDDVAVTNNSISMKFLENLVAISIGIYVELSSSISLTGNSIEYAAVGIETVTNDDFNSSVIAHHNRLQLNEVNAIDTGGSENSWDDGIATGNYWDDYNGVDENADGIGDTPYVIDDDSEDRFPLMS